MSGDFSTENRELDTKRASCIGGLWYHSFTDIRFSDILLPMNIFFQTCMPQHALSRLMGCFGNCTWPWVKTPFIKRFVKTYGVDLSEAQRTQVSDYDSFNDFFTRQLKRGARQFDHPYEDILSPADGLLSQFGAIREGRCIQAKGIDFTVADLLADDQLATEFQSGQFATIYLSPKDYHRVHMPMTATLRKMIYVPGKLFSVNTYTADNLPGLFTKNERVVCVFDTDRGPMVQVMVGAMIVASIYTSWHGCVAPCRTKQVTVWDYSDNPITLQRGDEMGFFQMGSTTVTLWADDALTFSSALTVGQMVRVGQPIVRAC